MFSVTRTINSMWRNEFFGEAVRLRSCKEWGGVGVGGGGLGGVVVGGWGGGGGGVRGPCRPLPLSLQENALLTQNLGDSRPFRSLEGVLSIARQRVELRCSCRYLPFKKTPTANFRSENKLGLREFWGEGSG